MNRERWEQVRALYEQALEMPADRREEHVRRATADEDLAAEVLRLLASAPPSSFVEPPPRGSGDLFGLGLGGRRLGSFTLLRELGRGGMGVVYLARQERLERDVAVKVLPAFRRDQQNAVARFEREAQAASALDHPHIVQILASGEEQGLAWYAMRYVQGHDLYQELNLQHAVRKDASAAGLLLPPFDDPQYIGTVTARVADLAEALEAAHERGIVHRDVKPQNILLDEAGDVHLTDFGLARDQRFGSMTGSSVIQGTPNYMSPEQARAVREPIDHRTDVYSLCVVLYELLSLRRPFEGKTAEEVLGRIASGTHLELRQASARVPRDLAVICEKGMARRPTERYQTAGALAADLQRFLNHEAIAARPPTAWRLVRNWHERHPALSAALAVSLAAFLGAWWLAGQVSTKERTRARSRRVEAALDLRSWAGSEDAVADARRAVEQARAAEEAGGELGPLVERFEDRLDEDAATRAAAIELLYREGRGGFADEQRFGSLLAPSSLRDVLTGMQEAGRALTAHPRDERILRLAAVEEVFPRVEIRLSPRQEHLERATGPARAQALPVDPITGLFGDPVALGELPLAARLAPGEWRIVVELPGIGFGEYDRDLRLDVRPYPIEARIRSDAQATRGLVRLPAVRLDLDEARLGCCRVLEQVDLAEFYVGEAEVSNEEYLAFLTDTGHPAPKIWRDVGYAGDWTTLPGVAGDPRWFDLPAVGMSYFDMRAYAEWAGARLPTHYELEYALRGAEMLTEPAPGSGANVEGADGSRPSGDANRYTTYVRNALPVRADGYRQEPHGLFHAFGNVAEMTSSKLTEVQGGRIVANDWLYVSLGGAWDAVHDDSRIYEHFQWGIDDPYATTDVGFRCARSASVTAR